jgi:plastocyanin
LEKLQVTFISRDKQIIRNKKYVLGISFYKIYSTIGSMTNKVIFITLISISVAIVLSSLAIHSAFAATVNVSIPKGSSTNPANGFSPKVITIKAGDTVKWTNNDNTIHTVISGKDINDPNKGKLFDSGLTGPTALTTTGKTFEHTFTNAGTYPVFCEVHPGMAMTVTVK